MAAGPEDDGRPRFTFLEISIFLAVVATLIRFAIPRSQSLSRTLLNPEWWGYMLSRSSVTTKIVLFFALLLAIPVARAEGWIGSPWKRSGAEKAGTGTGLTRLGWGAIGMALLTLMSAGSTGNNLLYLLYSACVCALVVSALAGWWNLRGLEASAEVPGQAFRGSDFPLRLTLSRPGRWPSFGVDAVLGASRARAGTVRPGAPAALDLKTRAFLRGWNLIEGLVLESRFPFGLIVHRRRMPPPAVLALPRLREIHAAAEVRAQTRASGRPALRKGSGDELYGLRPYDPSDDVRRINWKVSARAGRPLVNEFCELQDSKVVVTVTAARGADAERRIEEAASACRYFIDAGVEVRLVTPESEIDYGRGLLHLDRLLTTLALLGDGRTPRPSAREDSPRAPELADTPALRRATFVGACIVYLSVFLVDDVNPRVWALMLPAIPLGWLVQEKRLSVMPDFAWSLLSVAVLAWTTLIDWRVSGVTAANTHLLMYLLTNRLLNPFRGHDLRQTFLIFFLAFFLVSGLTISPWYFASFVAYLAFSAVWLWLSAGASWERRGDWALALAGWTTAAALLCAVCFAVTPRSEGWRRINPILSGFSQLQAKGSANTGFTENIALGWFGELKRSSARVMKVEPLAPLKGTPAPMLLRGSAYDAFDGINWKKELAEFKYPGPKRDGTSTVGRGWALHKEGVAELRFPADEPPGAPPGFKFSLYPLGLSVIFTVGTPWFVGGVDDSAYFDYTDTLHFAKPYIGGIVYKEYPSVDRGGLRLGYARFDANLRARALVLPPDPGGKVKALALEASGGAADDAEKARRIERFLKSRYSYSTFADSRGRSLDNFLFGSKKGNCEYFASAGVVLLRELGVPARLVTGFVAEDWNEYGGYWDIRQRNAHAWVEAYLPGQGWTSFDPTPAQSAFSFSADALTRRMERLVDAIQSEWYRSVIGYDVGSQSNTFKKIGVAFSFSALFDWLRRLSFLGAGLWIGFGLWTEAVKARRRWETARRLGVYGRAEALLARKGLARPADLTPREFASSVASKRPELSALKNLAELHYRERYAGAALTDEQARHAERLLAELGAKL